MNSRWQLLRLSLTVFPAVIFLFLYSCTEPEIKKKQSTGNPTPPQPDPSTPPPPLILCKTELLYGYCDKISYFSGEKLTAYLQAQKPLELCRLTIYNLKGDSIFSVASSLTVQQIGSSPSSEGYGFLPTVDFTLPLNLVNGIYLIEHSIPFIIKPKNPVELLVVYPSNTANAYSQSGGKSLYTTDRPSQVSFHRPITLQGFSSVCLKWFTTLQGISIGYIADVDLDEFQNINGSKILCLVGHNEYWTRPARENFDKFINEGGHGLILSGNTMWWQVRYSPDKTRLICYKSKDTDPVSDPLLKTYLWNDPSLAYPIISSIGADFDLGGYGVRYTDKGWNGFKISNPASPLLEGLPLQKGDVITCPSVEYDGAPIEGWDEYGYPILDKKAMNASKVELIGFDRSFRLVETTGTFFVMQRSSSSGIIINTASTDWCSPNGMGGASGHVIKSITKNAIYKLLNGEPVFSE